MLKSIGALDLRCVNVFYIFSNLFVELLNSTYHQNAAPLMCRPGRPPLSPPPLTATAIKDTRDLWSRVNDITGKGSKPKNDISCTTADELNIHYSTVSTDHNYVRPLPRVTVGKHDKRITEEQVFKLLDTLENSSPGRDSIPSWFLRTVAPFLAKPLSEVYNLLLNRTFVPKQWESSIITPVAKSSKPAQCADFRPISVTPLLSRLMEKIVVSNFLYPALINPKCEQLFWEQFAFRPTGSTTSALISLIHHISSLLQNYPYVHMFALDFSKAFDTVRHSTLAAKRADLPIEDEVHNWVLEFLDDRVHCTKFGGIISTERRINASIVQGSGIGPVSYVICASDLHALHTGNAFDKYADDSYLVVPSINSSTIPDEFQHISDWA